MLVGRCSWELSGRKLQRKIKSHKLRPERTRISYFTSLTSVTYVVLPKENHMQLTEAATLDRKSGEADLSRCAPACRGARRGGICSFTPPTTNAELASTSSLQPCPIRK